MGSAGRARVERGVSGVIGLLTKGQEYMGQGREHYETRYQQRVVNYLAQRVAKLGMKMVPIEEAL